MNPSFVSSPPPLSARAKSESHDAYTATTPDVARITADFPSALAQLRLRRLDRRHPHAPVLRTDRRPPWFWSTRAQVRDHRAPTAGRRPVRMAPCATPANGVPTEWKNSSPLFLFFAFSRRPAGPSAQRRGQLRK